MNITLVQLITVTRWVCWRLLLVFAWLGQSNKIPASKIKRGTILLNPALELWIKINAPIVLPMVLNKATSPAIFQWYLSSFSEEVTVPTPALTVATVIVAFAEIGGTPIVNSTGYKVNEAIPIIPVNTPATKLMINKKAIESIDNPFSTAQFCFGYACTYRLI